MSDARALLRQQRAARRIIHPLAVYSDGGKLLCSLCREPVKAESLWEGHVRGEGHLRRLKLRDEANKATGDVDRVQRTAAVGAAGGEHDEAQAASLKRKLVGEDSAAASSAGTGHDDVTMEDYSRRKRSRPDLSAPRDDTPSSSSNGTHTPSGDQTTDSKNDKDKDKDSDRDSTRSSQPTTQQQQRKSQTQSRNRTLTPPSIARRASNTPSHGVEIQIPSRPATPRRESSSSSTPLTAGPSASTTTNTTTSLPSRNASHALAAAVASEEEEEEEEEAGPVSGATTAAPAVTVTSIPSPATTAAVAPPLQSQVNEDEWAAFEAEIAAASYDADATISAPAMTADQSAAAQGLPQATAPDEDEDDDETRRAKAAAAAAEEREEASRALEDEFEEMEELEARVRRLKEKREALRRSRAESMGAAQAVKAALGEGGGEEVRKDDVESAVADAEEEEEESDVDDDDDEWDGFRFRAAA